MAGKDDGGHPRMTAGYPIGSSSHSEEHKGVKETAQEMASSVAEATGQVKDKAKDLASGVASRAEETWRSAREGLQEGASAVAKRAEEFWDDVTSLIRRYPVASVAIAFGLGCLASCAMVVPFRSDDVARRMSRASS